VRTDGGTVTMAVAGEFDLSSAGYFSSCANEAIDADAGTVVIDLADLTFIDSTGVAALLATHQRLRGAGRSLRVVNVGPQPAGVFDMTGLSSTGLEIVKGGV
jgi:anti-sigma B factor antagonist